MKKQMKDTIHTNRMINLE